MEWEKLLSKTRTRPLMSGGGYSPPAGENRTEYERDYDRAIFSTPVRRLQDKTQVFPLDPSDAVRTRLTHSLEVSTVAEGIAAIVGTQLIKDGVVSAEGAADLRTVARTCGLIHDIGNPPFGHAGERAIAEWFETRKVDLLDRLDSGSEHADGAQLRQDFLAFEGNAQTFRLLARLQVFVDPTGLNMTSATLSAACKYIAPSHKTDKKIHPKSKPGYFASENDVIAKLREETGTGEARHPLTFLIEAADDIVYSTVDIEDGIKKGVITWDEVEATLIENSGSDSQVTGVVQRAKEYVDKRLPNLKGTRRDEIYAQSLRTSAIAYSVPAAASAFLDRHREIISGSYTSELVAEESFGQLVKAAKSVAKAKIYNSTETLRLELMGRGVIQDLMDIFYEGIEKPNSYFGRRVWQLLSNNYVEVYERDKAQSTFPEEYHRLQLLTDYIAGMTDTFAVQLRRYLFDG